RRYDSIIVPALTGAVADVLRRGEIGEHRRARRDAIAAVEPSGGRPRIPIADVHSRVAVAQLSDSELGAIGILCRIQRRLDLRKAAAAICGTPDALFKRRRVHRACGARVELDVIDPARGTEARLDESGSALERRIQADTLGLEQDEVRAPVHGLPYPEGRQAGSEANRAAAQDRAHSADGTR